MTRQKKIISILIFLIVTAAFVFVVYWLVSRHHAAQTGGKPASFKQFLGFETTTTPPPQTTSTLSSQFTGALPTTGTSPAPATLSTNMSQFTNDTVTPNNSSLVGNNTGPGTAANPAAANSTGPTGAPIAASGTSAQICTDADVNITFTPSELAELQALQNQFYTIAQTLHTDADVANEESNYTNFQLKNQKLTGLLNFCTTAAKNITNPLYQNKVPTPFWFNSADIRSNNGLILTYDDPNNPDTPTGSIGQSVPLGYLGVPGQIGGKVDTVYRGDFAGNALRSIEQVLRLNLW